MAENIVVNCPTCGKTYDLPADYVAQYAGHDALCEACGGKFVVPDGDGLAVEPDASPIRVAVDNSAMPLSYASEPVAKLPAPFSAWRVGYNIVVLRDAAVPARCAVCAEPVEENAGRTLTFRWCKINRTGGSPLSALISKVIGLLIVSLVVRLFVWQLVGRFFTMNRVLAVGLILVVAAYFASIEIIFRAYYCRRHSVRMFWMRAVCLALAVLGFGCIASLPEFSASNRVLFWIVLSIGIMILLGAWVLYMSAGRGLYLVHVEDRAAVIAGCGYEFLKSVPTLKAAQAAATAAAAASLENVPDCAGE